MNSKQYRGILHLWHETRSDRFSARRAVCQLCGHVETVRAGGNALGQVAKLRAKIAKHVRGHLPETSTEGES